MVDSGEYDSTDLAFDRQRLQAEWAALNAFREMLGIALKGKESPTYTKTFLLARDAVPDLFGPDSILANAAEPEEVRMYRQKAEAESLRREVPVSPLAIVDEEITEYEALLAADPSKTLLEKPLNKLRRIRAQLTQAAYTENQIIMRDAFQASHLPIPSYMGDSWRDFRISENRGLRIRILHPDKAEQATGADLIYEQHWADKGVARLTAVQYKVWDGERLYFSKATNLEDQLIKLKSTFCDRGLCHPSTQSKSQDKYRLPYCAAFLRPTDKLQERDIKLVSTGLHVPVCVVNRLCQSEKGVKKIERKCMRGESLSQTIFSELFNYNMCGTRWLLYQELSDFYQANSVIRNPYSISIFAQEFDVPVLAGFTPSKGRRRRRQRP
jgi:hypothetical protein